MSATISSTAEDRRKRIFVGKLPDDFLRVGSSVNSNDDADMQAAIALHRQLNMPSQSAHVMGRLHVTVDQAKLVKNYGFSRMDPFVRLRVGHSVYETQTDTNGGKNPHWNKSMAILISRGVQFLNVEIYDERTFSLDELIAWAQIKIPSAVFRGETHEEWFPLSGKQGEGQEGAINLVMSFEAVLPVAATSSSLGQPFVTSHPNAAPVVMVPRTGHHSSLGFRRGDSYASVPVYIQPTPQIQPDSVTVENFEIKPEDLEMVQEMFPNLDKDVIKSVFEVNKGDKSATVNSLLRMATN